MSKVLAKPGFNIHKTTEAAAYLLDLCGPDRPTKFMKILKLLYLADREALARWEKPITYDAYCSMDNGQVLSNTYDLMKREQQSEIWDAHIEHLRYLWIKLKAPVHLRKLSPAEATVLQFVFDKYGHLDEFELGDLTHKLPEYKESHGSSIPTSMQEILGHLDYGEDDILRINESLAKQARLDAVFSP